jgi:hypothetical protein
MGMERKRNTEPARLAAISSKYDKRAAKKREIINEMCPEYCKSHVSEGCCRDGTPPKGAVLLGCVKLKTIANHLNTWHRKTLTGKTGTWQASTVGNVFKEELAEHKARKSDTSSAEKPADHAGIIW